MRGRCSVYYAAFPRATTSCSLATVARPRAHRPAPRSTDWAISPACPLASVRGAAPAVRCITETVRLAPGAERNKLDEVEFLADERHRHGGEHLRAERHVGAFGIYVVAVGFDRTQDLAVEREREADRVARLRSQHRDTRLGLGIEPAHAVDLKLHEPDKRVVDD